MVSKGPELKLPEGVTFYGIWRNNGTWKDYLIGNRITRFDPVYGHRSNPGTSIICQPNSGHRYLFVIDKDGFVPTSCTENSTKDRIRKAKEQGKKVIFLVGGSSVFGMGASCPERNLASALEQLLKKESDNCIIVNAGQLGYTTDIQLRFLVHELIPLGPDIIIFYDGWNDCSYTNGLLTTFGPDFIQGRSWQSYSTLQRHQMLLSFTKSLAYSSRLGLRLMGEALFSLPVIGSSLLGLLRKLCPALFKNPFTSDVQKRVFHPRSLDIYAYNLFTAAQICKAHRVRFMHFLQPLMFPSKKPLSQKENEYHSRFDGPYRQVYIDFYDRFEKRNFPNSALIKDVDSHSLRELFDHERGDIFIDEGHLNDRGNQSAAAAILSRLSPSLTNPAH